MEAAGGSEVKTRSRTSKTILTHRQRLPNFTKEEEKVLIALASKYKNEIHCQGSNQKTWRLKNLAWQKIATEFTNITNIDRMAVKLRAKYESLRKKSMKSDKMESTNNTIPIKHETIEPEVSIEDSIEDSSALSQSVLQVTLEDPRSPLKYEHKPEVSDVTTSSNVNETETELEPKPKADRDNHHDPEPFIPIPISIPKSLDTCKNCEVSYHQYRKALELSLSGKEDNENGDIPNMPLEVSAYRNRERRAEEKHLAEITNLQVQRQVLELDLKIKEQIYNMNNNNMNQSAIYNMSNI